MDYATVREQDRRRKAEWLTANGIDPARVPEDTTLAFDYDSNTVTFDEVVFDEAGNPVLDQFDRPVRIKRTGPVRVPWKDDDRDKPAPRA